MIIHDHNTGIIRLLNVKGEILGKYVLLQREMIKGVSHYRVTCIGKSIAEVGD